MCNLQQLQVLKKVHVQISTKQTSDSMELHLIIKLPWQSVAYEKYGLDYNVLLSRFALFFNFQKLLSFMICLFTPVRSKQTKQV